MKQPQKRTPNRPARFLGGVVTTMAIMLALTGLLLHASMVANTSHAAELREHQVKVRNLENQVERANMNSTALQEKLRANDIRVAEAHDKYEHHNQIED